ncbi:TPA: adenylate/guanylate cyclase domain-containing protein [Staphylococcus aureus]
MKAKHINFDFEKSLKRIDSILNEENEYKESNNIPSVENLTYKNGEYVKCASLFIDLRGSTDLIENQGKKSRSLARIYRAYISEIIAIANSFKTCKEINIVGDCVSAMFAGNNEEAESPVIEALQAASMSNAMMKVLNVKYQKKWDNLDEIKAGIGVALGRALVIKAGFSGSGIEELVYMGDVVNRASKMCGLAYKEYDSPICVTQEAYENAGKFIANKDRGKTFQDYLNKKTHDNHGNVYVGNFFRLNINDWAKENS